MSTRTDEPTVTHAAVAAALAALRSLLIAGHVSIRDLWEDMGSGPGRTFDHLVEASIIGRPAARETLLAGMTEVDGPSEWQGTHYVYREWRGKLLTMPILVSERLDPTTAGLDWATVTASGDRELRRELKIVETTDESKPEPADPNACCCWATSRNGCPVHFVKPDQTPVALAVDMAATPRDAAKLAAHAVGFNKGVRRGRAAARTISWEPMDECACKTYGPGGCPDHYLSGADPQPLLELLLDERFGPPPVPLAPIEHVIPGPDGDPSIESTYARYARARALHYFGSRRFPSVDDAREAIGYWPGRDMLNNEDVETVAGSLVDPPRVPEPEPERPAGFLRRLTQRAEATR